MAPTFSACTVTVRAAGPAPLLAPAGAGLSWDRRVEVVTTAEFTALGGVLHAADVDGDGRADLVLGCPQANMHAGRVLVLVASPGRRAAWKGTKKGRRAGRPRIAEAAVRPAGAAARCRGADVGWLWSGARWKDLGWRWQACVPEVWKCAAIALYRRV